MRSVAVTSSNSVAVAQRRSSWSISIASVVKDLPALSSRRTKSQWLRRIGRPHEDHVRRHRAPAGRVASRGDDRLPEHLAAFHDGAEMAGPRDAGEPVRTVGPDIEHVDELRCISPRREALDGDTGWIAGVHRVHEFEDHSPVIEDGEPGQPLRRRRVGEGPQNVPTVQAMGSLAPPVTGRLLRVSARSNAPRGASFDREGRGAAGLRLGVERIQPHVLQGEEERWWLTRPLDAEGRRGLGHELVAPPGPYRQGAGETFERVRLRWYGRGRARLGVRSSRQRRCGPGRPAGAAARADIPDDAIGLRPPQSPRSPRPSRGIGAIYDGPPLLGCRDAPLSGSLLIDAVGEDPVHDRSASHVPSSVPSRHRRSQDGDVDHRDTSRDHG